MWHTTEIQSQISPLSLYALQYHSQGLVMPSAQCRRATNCFPLLLCSNRVGLFRADTLGAFLLSIAGTTSIVSLHGWHYLADFLYICLSPHGRIVHNPKETDITVIQSLLGLTMQCMVSWSGWGAGIKNKNVFEISIKILNWIQHDINQIFGYVIKTGGFV